MSKSASLRKSFRRVIGASVIAALLAFGLSPTSANAVSGNTTVRVHLFTNNTDSVATMQNWQIYTWNAGGTATQGPNAFGTFTSFSGSDTYGALATLNYTSVSNFTSIGFKIAYQGNWSNVDQNYDRFISVTSNSQDVWLKIGDGTVYTSDPLSPVSSIKNTFKFHYDGASPAVWVSARSKVGNSTNYINSTWLKFDGTTANTTAGTDTFGKWVQYTLPYYTGQMDAMFFIVANTDFSSKDGGGAAGVSGNRWISTTAATNAASTDVWFLTGDSTSWSGNAAFASNPYGSSAPTVTSVTNTTVGSGSTGKAGDTLSIAGANLVPSNAIPARTSQPTVTIGGASATVSPAPTAGAASISVLVPSGLSAGAKDVVVTNAVGTVTSTGAFTVAAVPTITSLSSTTPVRGQSITVTGTNLTGATFTVGGVAATVTSASATAPVITVPTSAPVSAGSVVATTIGGSASTSVTVTKGTPTLTSPLATAIDAGSMLSTSTLSGGTATINGVTVAGTFAWTSPSAVPTAGTGNYSVTFTPTDSTGFDSTTTTASVEAGKTSPTISVTPAAGAITYGQTLSSSSLTGGSASVAGTFAFATPTAAPTAGTANQSVTFTPTDTASYNTVVINVSVTVNKATPTIVATPTAAAITYGAVLSTATLSSGSASVAGAFAYATPGATPGAGTASQSVTFTPTDTANYNTVTGISVSVTVNKATPTLVAPTATGLVTGQSLSSSTLSGGSASSGASSVAGSFAWTSSGTVPSIGTASYGVTFTPTDTANYNTNTTNVSVTTYGIPTISSVTPTSGASSTSVTISGTYLSNATVTIGGAAAAIATNTATSISVTVPVAATLGAGSVTVTTNGGSVSSDFNVLQAPAITSLSSSSVARGGTLTINGTGLSGATVTIGGTAVSISSNSSTAIAVTVPASLSFGSQSVVVTTVGGSATDSSFSVAGYSTATLTVHYNKQDFTNLNTYLHSWVQTGTGTASGTSVTGTFSTQSPETSVDAIGYDSYGAVAKITYTGSNIQQVGFLVWTLSGGTFNKDAGSSADRYRTLTSANDEIWIRNYDNTVSNSDPFSTVNPNPNRPTTQSVTVHYDGNTTTYPKVYLGTRSDLNDTALSPYSYWVASTYLDFNSPVTVSGANGSSTSTVGSDTFGKYVTYTFPYNANHTTWANMIVGNAGLTSKDGGQAGTGNRYVALNASGNTEIWLVSGDTSGNAAYTSNPYSAPVVSSLSASTGNAGDSLTITGTSLKPQAGNNPVVTIGGVTATVTSASSTSVVVTVPDGVSAGVASAVVVSTVGGTSNTDKTFLIKATAQVEITGTSKTYSGSAQGVTVTTTPAGLGVTVTYDGAATVPTNAGSYSVSVSINEADYKGSASATLVIGSATPNITWPSASAIRNPAALSTSSLTGGSATFGESSVAGTFAWASPSVVPAAGTDDYDVTFTPSSANFSSVTNAVALTVSEALTEVPTIGTVSQTGLTVSADITPASDTSIKTVEVTVGGESRTYSTSGDTYTVTLTRADLGSAVIFSAVSSAIGKADSTAVYSDAFTFSATAAPTSVTASQVGLNVSAEISLVAGTTVGSVHVTVGTASPVSVSADEDGNYIKSLTRADKGKSVVFTVVAAASGKADSDSTSSSSFTFGVANAPTFGTVSQSGLVISVPVIAGEDQSVGSVTATVDGVDVAVSNTTNTYRVTVSRESIGKAVVFTATAAASGLADSESASTDSYTVLVAAAPTFGAVTQNELTISAKVNLGGDQTYGAVTASVDGGEAQEATFQGDGVFSITVSTEDIGKAVIFSATATQSGKAESEPTSSSSFTVATPEPQLSNLTVEYGIRGASVTANGNYLTGATVKVGGVTAEVTLGGYTSLTFTVPAGVASGLVSVSVTTSSGTSSSLDFTVADAPTITGFASWMGTSAPYVTNRGRTFDIYGTNLTNASFTVGDVPVSTVVPGSTVVRVMLPADAALGADQEVVATTTYGGSSNIMYVDVIEHLPVITGFGASAVRPGELLTIYGNWLDNPTKVRFSRGGLISSTIGTDAALTGEGVELMSTAITVRVPLDAQTGRIRIYTPVGFIQSTSILTVYPAPKITTMKIGAATATGASRGKTVSLTGTGFINASVTIGGVSAQIASTPAPKDTAINVVVPNGVTPGALTSIIVTSQYGVPSTSKPFTVGYDQPVISSLSVSAAKFGALVTINGHDFTGTSSVKFNSNKSANLSDPATVITDTAVTVKVPTGAINGVITLTARGGVVTSGSFTVYQPPTITTVTPAVAKAGAIVTIAGSNLNSATFTVGGVAASAAPGYTATSSTAKIIVPAGAAISSAVGDSSVEVTANGGTANKAFTVVAAPTIAGIGHTYPSMTTVTVGGALIIWGDNLRNPSASPSTTPISVKIGAVSVTTTWITTESGNYLQGTVPLSATAGSATISVVTLGGSVSRSVTVLPLAPTISKLGVVAQNRGLTVQISGTSLAGSTVTIGGVSATVSTGGTPTSLTVTVPLSAPLGNQDLTVTNASGSATKAITVKAHLPVVSNVAHSGTKRGVGTVTITGSYLTGATVKVGAVTVSSAAVNINEAGTSLTFTIPPTALANPYATITITNSGGAWASSTAAQKIAVTTV